MPSHCFNILTFNHPQEEQTFYFTDQEQVNLTRVYKSLVPDEVIEKYGEQDHYYTSFTDEQEGFLAVSKPTSPQFEKMMMDKVMEKVSGMMPKVLDQGLPKVTGPSMPIIK